MSSSARNIRSACLGALLGAALALAPSPAAALNVNAVYRAACAREVGVILRVEKRVIHLLRQDGSVIKIPRHEIVSLVYYPVAQFPLAQLPPPDAIKPVRVQTREARREVELAFGWPINFSQRKMSLLLPSGKDFTVDKGSVWALRYDSYPSRARPAPPPMPRFEHPQTSGFCDRAPARPSSARSSTTNRRPTSQPASPPAASQPSPAPSQPASSQPRPAPSQPSLNQPADSPGAGRLLATSRPAASRPATVAAATASRPERRRIFPQQILNDQVVIRRELNRLMKGYEELVEDIDDQKFYPIPQIYKDRTSLGFWGSFLSRYGASETRSNNLTPLLTNTFSSGPFRYQHIFFTGSTPNQLLIHNESQTQIFYRFKAAYFHTSLLIDPSLALVGDNYWWREGDFADETLDDRINEYAIVELGFDVGPVAIQLQPVAMASGAVKHGEFFTRTQAIPLWRAGARLTFADFSVEVMAGYSPEREGEIFIKGNMSGTSRSTYTYGRLNLEWRTPWYQILVRSWTAVRHLEHELRAIWADYNSDATGAGRFGRHPDEGSFYRSLSVSSALQVTHRFWHRFEVGGHAILEVQRRQRGDEPAKTRALPKLSLFGSMSF